MVMTTVYTVVSSFIYTVGMSAQNREKLISLPPLSAKCPHWLKPPLSLVHADTPLIPKNPMCFAPKSADVRIWRPPRPQNVRTGYPPWLWTSLMDRPQLPFI